MSARQRAKKDIRATTEAVSPLGWIGAIGIALFLLIYPYDRGLFNGYESSFEPSLYGALIFISILLIPTSLYLINNWKLGSYRGILTLAILAIPLIYWISSFNAVSDHNAKLMVLIYTGLASLFIAGLYFGEAASTRFTIEGALMLSSYMIVLYGLFNLFGQVYYNDALWSSHDGFRLASAFQYSNTYAGFLIAIFLMALYYAVHSERFYLRLIHAAMLVPIWISFMVTYSRGAIVVIPVIVIILIPFFKLSKQIAYILFMGISIVTSMLVLGKVTTAANAIADIVQPNETRPPGTISLFNALPLQGWGFLLLAAAITTALILLYRAKADAWVDAKLAKFAIRKWSFVAIPVAVILLAGISAALLLGSSSIRGLLPEQLSSRLENLNFNQHSVLERLTFYKDGLELSKDYPLLGGGGGAWQALYEQYQNNPYSSRQAHSFFVQVLVESGWLGLLTMVALIGFIYVLYFRAYIRFPELRGSHFVFFIMSLSLLVHSAIDFDMSYLYISALVFISLGCMLAPYGSKLIIPKLEKPLIKTWQKTAIPVLLTLIAITSLFTTIQENRAVNGFFDTITMARQQQASFGQLINQLDKSIKLSPKQVDYSILKADWLMQSYEQTPKDDIYNLAYDTIMKAKKYDPYHRGLITMELKLLQTNQPVEQSLPVIEEGLTKFPWDITFYERAITTYDQAREKALTNSDQATADQHKQRIAEIADEIQRRIDLLATLPEEQLQGNPFNFTPPMQTVLSKLQLS